MWWTSAAGPFISEESPLSAGFPQAALGRGVRQKQPLPWGWPSLWGKLEELVNSNTGPPDCRQAKTFDLTPSAPGSGLLLGLQWNNLNSTWRTKLLIKWNQTSFSGPRVKTLSGASALSMKQRCCVLGLPTPKDKHIWEDEGAREGRKFVFKFFLPWREKYEKKNKVGKPESRWSNFLFRRNLTRSIAKAKKAKGTEWGE